ncbi:MAG: hypothetical protein WCK55_12090 [Verrucomicrobiota bacterium]|nr:hypothetical protein [Verrucomicrobiota bacterium]
MLSAASFSLAVEPLPGTQPLTAEGDLSVQMVDGIHRWLQKEWICIGEARDGLWMKDTFSVENWPKIAVTRRSELARIIGTLDERHPGALQVVADAGAAPMQPHAAGYTTGGD